MKNEDGKFLTGLLNPLKKFRQAFLRSSLFSSDPIQIYEVNKLIL